MDKEALEAFLLKARTKTYAAAKGGVKPVLIGSKQLEYKLGDFLYRDIYFVGNGIFPGLETVYFKDQAVWSMSYFGDFRKMSEDQVDAMLRKALIDNWQGVRIYKTLEKDYGNFTYRCDGSGSIDRLEGSEEISIKGRQVYIFYYGGGFIG